MWHGFSNTGIHVLRISSKSTPILYLPGLSLPVGLFPLWTPSVCGGHACSGKKIEFPFAKQCIVTAYHCKTPHLVTIVLFSSHCDKWAISVSLPLFLFDCHNWCAPHDTSTIIRPDLLHWRPSLSCANCFLENVKPSPQSDNVRHSEYRELSIDSTHLTVTFSNLK